MLIQSSTNNPAASTHCWVSSSPWRSRRPPCTTPDNPGHPAAGPGRTRWRHTLHTGQTHGLGVNDRICIHWLAIRHLRRHSYFKFILKKSKGIHLWEKLLSQFFYWPWFKVTMPSQPGLGQQKLNIASFCNIKHTLILFNFVGIKFCGLMRLKLKVNTWIRRFQIISNIAWITILYGS